MSKYESIPESYHGREQAYVKHKLLDTYLQRLFMIIGQHQRSIRYVDCFSGPWQEGSKDLEDTSIGIALKNIRECRNSLNAMGKSVTFHALFIEKNQNAYQRLQTHLSSLSSEVHTTAFHGDFYELRSSILEWCGPHDFTFFFIDPKGWKNVIEIPTLSPLIQRPNSEFLINFMYDFLLRTHTQGTFSKDIHAIFGEVPDTEGLVPSEKEKHLLDLYRKRLKAVVPLSGGKPRTATVPVQYPTKDRTLYHLVYLTRHSKGIEVFMHESEKLDLVQRRTRAQAKQDDRVARTGQMELLDATDSIRDEDHIDQNEVKNYWLKRLSNTPTKYDMNELADMLEETGWFERDLQTAFGELVKEGKVRNLDATSKRRSKFIHFDKDERLRKE